MTRTLAATVHGVALLALLLILGAALTDHAATNPFWGFVTLALWIAAADQIVLWPLWATVGRNRGWHPIRGWIR